MIISDTAKTFENMGGEFISSPIVLSKKLKNLTTWVFDWDGVWHAGRKSGNGQSSFSEVDSMGLNMLRFGYYLQNGTIPLTLIITGENNHTAFDFAKREHLDGVFFKAKNKKEALAFVQKKWQKQAAEIGFVFDDILDLGMAEKVGAGFVVKGTGNPLFKQFVANNNLADYATAQTGHSNAVREVSELSLGLINQFENAVKNRMAFTQEYDTYLQLRNQIDTLFFTQKDGVFSAVKK